MGSNRSEGFIADTEHAGMRAFVAYMCLYVIQHAGQNVVTRPPPEKGFEEQSFQLRLNKIVKCVPGCTIYKSSIECQLGCMATIACQGQGKGGAEGVVMDANPTAAVKI
ncbi:hypothetical protein CIHG_08677 [Coccidioides immitis H538.4]|uniref:Uncharacterized protein n=3 Tax=Coccidioides immitis TaxID=5501 RepID=A0A0J8TU77_COCIT|nr:hypothetical protein CIRG_02620 [Coccidioides immitis RMSCC 2394]KMU77372.1 hypothetical protein CISG_06618 [Coccidioides immitis RMSCC 3703]KMU90718.1 hypothetical protein CIHG_08677 [Coccidioides immitis H538.4]